jgi:hypothetical protein
MVSFSSSASTLARPAWPSICRGGGGPPSQGWKTFLRNHADGVAAMDFFVVPMISFRLLYGLLIMGHGRRQILWLGSPRFQRPNGSSINWQRRGAGNKSLVT